jgi:hypothetical protein
MQRDHYHYVQPLRKRVTGIGAVRDNSFRMAMCMRPAPLHLAFIHHRAPLVYGMDAVNTAERTQIIENIAVTRH